MKNKEMANFWLGFFLAALAAVWLYWLWRRNREVLPEPVIVTRKSAPVPEDEQVDMQPDSESRIQLKPRQELKQGVSQPDPLDTIDGIGPTYKQRLNESGIYTFAQLADTSPELLKEITGVTRWDPADWISEARQLININ